MLKAGANQGATGENAIVQNMSEMDIIVGTIGIVVAHSISVNGAVRSAAR